MIIKDYSAYVYSWLADTYMEKYKKTGKPQLATIIGLFNVSPKYFVLRFIIYLLSLLIISMYKSFTQMSSNIIDNS